jgi:hypothetical protein
MTVRNPALSLDISGALVDTALVQSSFHAQIATKQMNEINGLRAPKIPENELCTRTLSLNNAIEPT